jgi:hypothetical protein
MFFLDLGYRPVGQYWIWPPFHRSWTDFRSAPFSRVIGRLPNVDPDRLRAMITIMFKHHDAARFRTQAEEATEEAAKALSPLHKEAWLRVAAEWLKLAFSDESRK